jgi:hypothetical protein
MRSELRAREDGADQRPERSVPHECDKGRSAHGHCETAASGDVDRLLHRGVPGPSTQAAIPRGVSGETEGAALDTLARSWPRRRGRIVHRLPCSRNAATLEGKVRTPGCRCAGLREPSILGSAVTAELRKSTHTRPTKRPGPKYNSFAYPRICVRSARANELAARTGGQLPGSVSSLRRIVAPSLVS